MRYHDLCLKYVYFLFEIEIIFINIACLCTFKKKWLSCPNIYGVNSVESLEMFKLRCPTRSNYYEKNGQKFF